MMRCTMVLLALGVSLFGCGTEGERATGLLSGPTAHSSETYEESYLEMAAEDTAAAAALFDITGSATARFAGTNGWAIGTLSYSWATEYKLVVSGEINQGGLMVSRGQDRTLARRGIGLGFSGQVKDSTFVLSSIECGGTLEARAQVSGALKTVIPLPGPPWYVVTELGSASRAYDDQAYQDPCQEQPDPQDCWEPVELMGGGTGLCSEDTWFQCDVTITLMWNGDSWTIINWEEDCWEMEPTEHLGRSVAPAADGIPDSRRVSASQVSGSKVPSADVIASLEAAARSGTLPRLAGNRKGRHSLDLPPGVGTPEVVKVTVPVRREGPQKR